MLKCNVACIPFYRMFRFKNSSAFQILSYIKIFCVVKAKFNCQRFGSFSLELSWINMLTPILKVKLISVHSCLF